MKDTQGGKSCQKILERKIKMVAIFKYEAGLKFTGKIAKDKTSAWKYLDKTYGCKYHDIQLPCNHDAFTVIEVEEVED